MAALGHATATSADVVTARARVDGSGSRASGAGATAAVPLPEALAALAAPLSDAAAPRTALVAGTAAHVPRATPATTFVKQGVQKRASIRTRSLPRPLTSRTATPTASPDRSGFAAWHVRALSLRLGELTLRAALLRRRLSRRHYAACRAGPAERFKRRARTSPCSTSTT